MLHSLGSDPWAVTEKAPCTSSVRTVKTVHFRDLYHAISAAPSLDATVEAMRLAGLLLPTLMRSFHGILKRAGLTPDSLWDRATCH